MCPQDFPFSYIFWDKNYKSWHCSCNFFLIWKWIISDTRKKHLSGFFTTRIKKASKRKVTGKNWVNRNQFRGFFHYSRGAEWDSLYKGTEILYKAFPKQDGRVNYNSIWQIFSKNKKINKQKNKNKKRSKNKNRFEIVWLPPPRQIEDIKYDPLDETHADVVRWHI